MALAHRLGLDTHCVIEAFENGPLVSPWAAEKFRRIENDDYSPEFPLRLALKDLHLALEHGGPERFVALASLAQEWEQIVEQGAGDEDVTVVTRVLER
jgi:3-hydroxyisobutyrate dehydrogenase